MHIYRVNTKFDMYTYATLHTACEGIFVKTNHVYVSIDIPPTIPISIYSLTYAATMSYGDVWKISEKQRVFISNIRKSLSVCQQNVKPIK